MTEGASPDDFVVLNAKMMEFFSMIASAHIEDLKKGWFPDALPGYEDYDWPNDEEWQEVEGIFTQLLLMWWLGACRPRDCSSKGKGENGPKGKAKGEGKGKSKSYSKAGGQRKWRRHRRQMEEQRTSMCCWNCGGDHYA